MTLDSARIDLRRAFVEGMGYVALSRVRGLRYLILDALNDTRQGTAHRAANYCPCSSTGKPPLTRSGKSPSDATVGRAISSSGERTSTKARVGTKEATSGQAGIGSANT